MRWLTTFIVMLALAPAPATADGSRLTVARSSVDKGDKLLAKGRLDAAEKAFRKAIENEPRLPTAYHGLARALEAQQRFAEAIPVLDDAKDRYVRWSQEERATEMQARQDAADRARAFRDLQTAQQVKRNAQTSQPAADLTRLAAARVATEEYLSRGTWKMENLESIPADVFYLDGLARLRTGDKQNGIAALETCLILAPVHGLAHYNLAVALFTSGEIQAAKSHLDAAVAAGVEPNPRFAADVAVAAKARPEKP